MKEVKKLNKILSSIPPSNAKHQKNKYQKIYNQLLENINYNFLLKSILKCTKSGILLCTKSGI